MVEDSNWGEGLTEEEFPLGIDGKKEEMDGGPPEEDILASPYSGHVRVEESRGKQNGDDGDSPQKRKNGDNADSPQKRKNDDDADPPQKRKNGDDADPPQNPENVDDADQLDDFDHTGSLEFQSDPPQDH